MTKAVEYLLFQRLRSNTCIKHSGSILVWLFFLSVNFKDLFHLIQHPYTSMKCTFCEIDFPLLGANASQPGRESLIHKCGKCYLRRPGLSATELTVLNVSFAYMVPWWNLKPSMNNSSNLSVRLVGLHLAPSNMHSATPALVFTVRIFMFFMSC